MPPPRVRDLSGRRRLRVEVDRGPAYELLIALTAFGGEEPEASYEVGAAWFRAARRSASAKLRADLRTLVGRSGWLFISLTGTIRDSRGTSVSDLLAHLDEMEPAAIHAVLLEKGHEADDDAEPALRRLRRHSPGQVKDLLVSVVGRFYEDVFREQEEALMRVIDADAATRRRLVDRVPPLRLIEETTNGIAYQQEPGISTAVLIPTVINRPWVTIAERGPEKYFYYPAAEPATPPERRPATVYNALGDETRLRILRRLARGPITLSDLAEELGLAKSTVHQHMVLLRDARLIQTLLGAAHGYRLAEDRPDLEELLRIYLKGAEARSRRPTAARRRPGSR